MIITLFLFIMMAMTLFKPTMHFQFDKKQAMRLKGILAILIVMYHTKMNVVGGFIDTYWGYVIVSMFIIQLRVKYTCKLISVIDF